MALDPGGTVHYLSRVVETAPLVAEPVAMGYGLQLRVDTSRTSSGDELRLSRIRSPSLEHHIYIYHRSSAPQGK